MSMEIQGQEKTQRDIIEDKFINLILEENFVIDSRLFAKWIKKDHHAVIQAINRSRDRLEQKTVLARREHKPEGRLGGRPEVYYQLTDRQSLILLSVLSTGERRDYIYDLLVDAFLSAKEKLFQLRLEQEKQKLLISDESVLEQLLDEKFQDVKNQFNERLDGLEQKIEANSPKTLIRQTLGKAKISDLK